MSAALPEGAKCYYHNDTRFNKKYIDLYIYNDERYPIGITIARDEERKYDNEIIFKKYNPWRGNFGIEEAEKRIHLLRTQPTLIEEWNKHIDRMEEIRMLFNDRSSFEFKEY